MSEEADRFRRCAADCRERALLSAYDMREFFLELADQLEAEADVIDTGRHTRLTDWYAAVFRRLFGVCAKILQLHQPSLFGGCSTLPG